MAGRTRIRSWTCWLIGLGLAVTVCGCHAQTEGHHDPGTDASGPPGAEEAVVGHPGENHDGSRAARPRPGDVWVEELTGMRFRYVPAGSFVVGDPRSDDFRGRYRATLTRGFWIGETEVTRHQMRSASAGATIPGHASGLELPLSDQNWWSAVRFANLLSDVAGLERCYETSECTKGEERNRRKMCCEEVVFFGLDCEGLRLPTEAEWERAARAGSNHLYAGGDELSEVGWYVTNNPVPGRYGRPLKQLIQAVATLNPNDWGISDMSGNMEEWVWDRAGDLPFWSETDSLGPEKGEHRVLRGGHYYAKRSECATHIRRGEDPCRHELQMGFRLVRSDIGGSPAE